MNEDILQHMSQHDHYKEIGDEESYRASKNFVQSKIDPNEKFSIPLITEDKVTNLLAILEENKATGLDGVSTKLLQLSAPVLSKTITRLLNLSIATGTFPS